MSFNTFGHLVPRHDLRRKPRAAIGCVVDGCPPAHRADRGRHPALSRQAPAGPVALHHPAAGTGHGRKSSPACSRRGDRPAGDDRHADRAASSTTSTSAPRTIPTSRTSIGPATPTTPTTSNTASAIIAAAAAPVGARDRDAGRRRRDRAQDRAGHERARRADPDGTARRSIAPRWDWDEVERNPFFCPDAQQAARLRGAISTTCASAAPRSAP